MAAVWMVAGDAVSCSPVRFPLSLLACFSPSLLTGYNYLKSKGLIACYDIVAETLTSTFRALEIYMLAAPEPRPVSEGQIGRDLRRPDAQVEAGVAIAEGQPERETSDAPHAGQPTALLGGPV